MKDVVEYEVMKNLNWKERVIFKLFEKTVIKVCNIIRISVVNSMLKN